ncbi:MAG: leucine-rich repeat domain-containing protein [Candidatus Latescibacterota bacterium]
MKACRLLRVLAAVLALSGGCSRERSPAATQEPGGDGSAGEVDVVFAVADTALARAIRAALAAAEVLPESTRPDALRSLVARGGGIASLEGIQQLAGLEMLDLADNAIRDLGPLGGLRSLRYLEVSNNRIQDVAALAGLEHLEYLGLADNEVTDLGPLLGLRSLQALEVSGNPLSARSRTEDAARLTTRGVAVTFVASGEGAEAWGAGGAGDAVPRLALVGGQGAQRRVYVGLNSEGTVRPLLPEEAYSASPAWSPDGTRLAFTSNRHDPAQHRYHVYTANPDGTELQRLTPEAGRYGDLSWSPDGTRLVLSVRRDGGQSEVHLGLVPATGGAVAPLTVSGFQDVGPSWSPQGDRVLFTRASPQAWDRGSSWSPRSVREYVP